MKILSFKHNKDAHIYICGVDGSGKKSFASVFFADKSNYKQLSLFKLPPKVKKLLVIMVLDGVHLQNLAEEEIFFKISGLCKKYRTLEISVLFVLNKVDLIYNRRQNPVLVDEVYTSYKNFFAQIACKEIKFIAFSYLATKIFQSLLSREIDDEDCDDAKTMLAKVGKHFPKKYNPREMKKYLNSHKNVFRILSGETLIARFIERWKEEQ